jgi:hypothetical protein
MLGVSYPNPKAMDLRRKDPGSEALANQSDRQLID